MSKRHQSSGFTGHLVSRAQSALTLLTQFALGLGSYVCIMYVCAMLINCNYESLQIFNDKVKKSRSKYNKNIK